MRKAKEEFIDITGSSVKGLVKISHNCINYQLRVKGSMAGY